MPNLGPSTAAPWRVPGRVAILAIAGVIGFGGVLADVAATRAVDLTPRISATRRNQITTEQSMRHADKQIKSAKRGLKVSRRKVKRNERRLEFRKARRAAAASELRQAQQVLEEARSAQLRPFSVLDLVPAGDATVAAEPVEAPIPTPAAIEMAVGRLAADEPPAGDPVVQPPPTAADIASLRTVVAKEKRQLRKAKKQLRKVQRKKRSSVANVRAFKRQRRANVVLRNRSERALGSWIKSMTSLAKKRAAKKFKVRPGRGGARFIRPSNGPLSQGYHRGHDGLDIVSYHGAPIRASAAGVVAYVGWNPWDKGKRAFVVVLGHSTGYETIYGHLRPIRRVRVGQEVRRGQLIGHMGSTGHSTGTHVHWEVSRSWRTLNPSYVL